MGARSARPLQYRLGMRPGKTQQTSAGRVDGGQGPGIRLDDEELDIMRSADPLEDYEEFVEPDESDERRRDPLRR